MYKDVRGGEGGGKYYTVWVQFGQRTLQLQFRIYMKKLIFNKSNHAQKYLSISFLVLWVGGQVIDNLFK